MEIIYPDRHESAGRFSLSSISPVLVAVAMQPTSGDVLLGSTLHPHPSAVLRSLGCRVGASYSKS